MGWARTGVLVGGLVASWAVATTVLPEPGQCPVCGERVTLLEIGSSNTLGGQDRDFFPRAFGSQPFEAAAVTSERCLYSGYAEDFLRLGDDGGVRSAPSLPESVRRAILDGGALRAPTAVRPLPGWARLDLIAQVLRLEDAGAPQLAEAYLHAAWAARIAAVGELPGAEGFEPCKGLTLGPPGRTENRALEELREARALLADGGAAGVRCAALLLRDHGEHEALLRAVPGVERAFGPAAWARLGPPLVASIERERGYQRQAAGFLRQQLAGPLPPARRATTLYLLGELERRLGHAAEARALLTQARDAPGAEDWLRRYAREQLDELPGAR